MIKYEQEVLSALQQLYFNSINDIGTREINSEGVSCAGINCSKCILYRTHCEK